MGQSISNHPDSNIYIEGADGGYGYAFGKRLRELSFFGKGKSDG
jgi:hypothetical protein